MPVVDNREVLFQKELLDKYARDFGLAADVGTRLLGGSVTDAEELKLAEISDQLVMRFKDDMRSMPFEQYSDQDLDIILRMIDVNHKPVEVKFDPQTGEPIGGETLSKVIPEKWVKTYLTPRPPEEQAEHQVITGFAAPSVNSQNLSPQQMITQFGLDYKDTSYLSEQGDQLVRQPYAFSLDAPMTNALADSIKIPMDPRLFQKLEARAKQDPKAAAIMAKYRDEVTLIAQGWEEKEALKKRYPGCDVVDAADPPYLGTSASMSGDKLASQNPYAAIMQEHYMHPVPGIPHGSKLTLKLPLDGSDPERGDVPAGVKTIEIAEFRDGQWHMLTDPDEVEMEFKLAMLNSSLFKYDSAPFEKAFAEVKDLFPKKAHFPKTPEAPIKKAADGESRAITHVGRGGDVKDAPRKPDPDKKRKTKKKKRPA